MFGWWKKSFYLKQKYSAPSRRPFFDLAGKYLPTDGREIVLDVGCGHCEFAKQLGLLERYDNFHPLDANPDLVKELSNQYKAIFYQAPGRLPFDNNSIAYVHCSHLIEHLSSRDLYKFMQEIDRVIKNEGRLVISAPLLWSRFYEDLSHVRPYNPEVLVHYLSKRGDNHSADQVSNKFKVLDLIYRYRCCQFGESWGSRYLLIDLFISCFRAILSKLKFCHFIKNGYTLVLEKQL